MFYFIIFIILAILSVADVFVSEKRVKKYMLFCVTCLLIFIAGFRYETGADWPHYARIFGEIPTLFSGFTLSDYGKEYAFFIICSIVKTLGGSIQTVFFIFSFFSISLVSLTLKKVTPYPIFGILIYFSTIYIVLEFVFTRQSVATSILFYSLIYIKDQKFIKFVLLVLAASLFHVTSLIFIPLYFLLNIKISKKSIVLTYLLGLFIYIANILWVYKTVIFFGSIFFPGYLWMIDIYLTHAVFSLMRAISISGLAINSITLILILSLYHRIKLHKYGAIMMNLCLLSIFLPLYMYELSELSNRIRFYFLMSYMALFPIIVFSCRLAYAKKAIYIFLITYSLLYSRNLYFEDISHVNFNPYQNYIVWKLLDLQSTGYKRFEEADRANIIERTK